MVTVVASEAMAVSTVMPLVERDLGDLWLYGWTFSAFFLGDLIGIVVGGRAADRRRPVMPLQSGVAVFSAGLLVGGLAPSMVVLVLGRALQGLGAGVVGASAYVCVGRGFTPAQRPRVFAVMSTAWVVPSLVAPLAASAVGSSVGWRWVFLGLVPIAVGAGAVAALSLRSVGPGGRDAGTTPAGAALLLAAGTGLLLAGLGAGSPWAVGGLAGLGLVAGLSALGRLVPPGTLRLAPGLPAAVGLRGILTFAFFSANAYISFALVSVRGAPALLAGAVLTSSSLAWTAGAWFQARMVERWGLARLGRLGGVALVAGLVLLGGSLAESVPVTGWFAAAVLAGFGMGVTYPLLAVVTLAGADPGREGAATSALQLTDVLGVAVGTGVGGVIVATGDRLGAPAAPTLAGLFALSASAAVAVAALSGRLGSAT